MYPKTKKKKEQKKKATLAITKLCKQTHNKNIAAKDEEGQEGKRGLLPLLNFVALSHFGIVPTTVDVKLSTLPFTELKRYGK